MQKELKLVFGNLQPVILNKFIYIFFSLFISLSFLAQTKKGVKSTQPKSAVTTKTQTPVAKTINIKHANSLSFDRDKSNAKVLTGNVVCEHDGAILNCDTALIFDEDQKMQASGHIVITKGDSITVTGDKLFYDGKTKMATLDNNVKCVEKDMTLTTNHLSFDVG